MMNRLKQIERDINAADKRIAELQRKKNGMLKKQNDLLRKDANETYKDKYVLFSYPDESRHLVYVKNVISVHDTEVVVDATCFDMDHMSSVAYRSCQMNLSMSPNMDKNVQKIISPEKASEYISDYQKWVCSHNAKIFDEIYEVMLGHAKDCRKQDNASGKPRSHRLRSIKTLKHLAETI